MRYLIVFLLCVAPASAWTTIDLDDIFPSFSSFPQVPALDECTTSLDCGISTECNINTCINAGYGVCQQVLVPAGASCGSGGYCDGNGNCLSAASVIVGDSEDLPGWGSIPTITIQPEPIIIEQDTEQPVCADTNECTDDVFNAETRQCQHVPLTGPACGSGSYCALGSCVVSHYCSDDNACTVDYFQIAAFTNCLLVSGMQREQISCDDGISTTIDSCDPQTGCVHTLSAPVPEFGMIAGIAAAIGGAAIIIAKRKR